MRHFQSKSVSLRYDAQEDRLLWISSVGDDQLTSVQITRRMLSNMLPNLAEWLNNNSDNQQSSKVQTSIEKQRVYLFEHEAAQHKVPMVHDVIPVKKVMLADFLLCNINLSITKKRLVKFALSNKENSVQIFSVMSFNELHKIIGELLKLSHAAGWGIQNPWKKEGAGTIHVSEKKVMH